MDENLQFDKSLKRGLESPPEFIVNQAGLDDMSRRLDGINEKKKWKGWWLLFPLFFAALAGDILFVNNKFAALEQELNQLKSNAVIIQNDTIIRKHITYQYDTIYNTIYKSVYVKEEINVAQSLERGAETNLTGFNSKGSKWNSFYVKMQPASFLFSEKRDPFLGSNFQGLFQLKNYSQRNVNLGNEVSSPHIDNISVSKTLGEILSIPSLAFKLLDFADFSLPYFEQKIPEHRKTRIEKLHYFSPKGLSIGVKFSPFGFGDISFSKRAYAYGLSAELEFSENFSLLFGLEKISFFYKLKDMTLFNQYPGLEPTTPGDMLVELKTHLNYLHVPIGFKYLFLTEHKLNLYLGGGIIASRMLSRKFKYEFIGSAGEYYLDQSFNSSVFSVKNIFGSFGMEYGFSKKVRLNVGCFYRHGFELEEGAYFKMRYLGLDLGLRYKI